MVVDIHKAVVPLRDAQLPGVQMMELAAVAFAVTLQVVLLFLLEEAAPEAQTSALLLVAPVLEEELDCACRWARCLHNIRFSHLDPKQLHRR